MAYSYKDSKNKTDAVTNSAPYVALFRNAELATAIEQPEYYTPCTDGRYETYSSYHDDNCSTIDAQKNIIVDATQVDIAQESNSQYKTFKLIRYQDGIDLMDMLIQIHYLNKNNSGDVINAVNVEYNDNYIKFGWLIDENVTAIAGNITFEITAVGVNEKNQSYKWRTRPNGKFTVLEALSYDHIIEPSNDWYTSFETMIMGYVSQASKYASEAKESAAGVNEESIKSEVTTAVTAELDTKISDKLTNYYDVEQVDRHLATLREFCEGIDSLSQLKVEYDNISGQLTFKDQNGETSITIASVRINSLSNLKVTYEVTNGKGSLIFSNGDTEITSVEIGNVEPSAEWTAAFREGINTDISTAKQEVQDSVDALKTIVDSINIDTLTTGLETLNTEITQTKKDVTSTTALAMEAKNAVDVLKTDVDANTEGIKTLNTGLSDLEKKVNEIEIQPSNSYDVNYTDNTFTFYENDEIKRQFIITGGGGTIDTSTITIERVTSESVVILSDGTAVIEYGFSSVDNAGDTTGNGTAAWKIGNTVVATTTAIQGRNVFDITQYLKTGLNNIRLTITDSFGTISSKTWSVTVVEFRIESIFDDSLFYSGEVTFRYTPYGDISKQIVFELDGKEIGGLTTTITGRQMTQSIPAQSHGAHLLKVYMLADINGQKVQSDAVYKDIIWIDTENTTPVIGCAIYSFDSRQYNTFSIPYVVYDPSNNPSSIQLSVDGDVISSLTIDRTRQIWSYKSSTIGEHTLTITCGEVSKTIKANIAELGIDISPVTTNLAFDFNPSGKNNGDSEWLKIDDNLTIAVSDNFDTLNGGFQNDKDGDTYFCVKAGTTATIPYSLFADDAKKTGKNFKLVYKCTNVKDYDAEVLSCYNNNIGLRVFAQEALLTSEQNSISVPYCEDNFMELEFNILPDAEYTNMVMWLDGIPSRVKIYSVSDSFTQTIPIGISIGSDNCDVWIYRMKAYTMNLTDDEILDNFIADAKNADEIISRYTRNDILDSSGNLDPDLLAEKCPDLRIIKIETPRFTTGKKDKVSTTSFQQIYKNGRRAIDNWTSLGGILSGQGTSSEYYGEAGRNLDLNCKNGFTFGDGTTADKYSMTENSVPVNYFNIKVNIASSENINNAGCAEEYNIFNPYIRPARVNDPRVRDTMEFHPCVIFIKETDSENAVEFNDGDWHFYACGNIGNSKKNAEAFGMDPENHKEFIVEVSNNTDPQCRFLSDDLSAEGWDGDTSFEMRYENPNCTPEELQAGKDAWQALLTWVVNATPEIFVAEFEDHFVKDSLLFYYLFTERHTLVDNRAKNTFWHTEDLIHWDLCMDYDNDTAMGNDNEGGLTLTYGYEDTDTIGSKSVFNASDSKIFCYIRDYMYDDLSAMFLKMESQLAWSANRILTKFEAEQAMKPERLWIMDMRRKYFRPYEENGTTSYLEMMHGSKKHQRRQFQKYQEKYMSSKYVGAVCTSDVITIRGYTPVNWTGIKPDGTFHIRPYADMYIVNRFGSNLTKVRAKRGQTYEIKSPIAAMNDTEVYTYNASFVSSIGDIAPFYPGYCDFNQGEKLTDLLIGSDTEGYVNTNMNDFGIGKNVLLERLNLQNLPSLKKTISLADCINLEEFYADGSGITGVIFAKSGKIRIAHLPAIASLSANNLYMLEDLTISDYSKITTLSIDNCPSIDELDLIKKSSGLTRLRLTGINWNLNSTDFLDTLTTLAGIDENGYNVVTSVLAGQVHVPIMREQKLAHYNSIWPDLDISYDTMITQYKVVFINDDAQNTELNIQYVDKGGDAIDPIENGLISIPTKESTISTNFTFTGWDDTFTNIFSDKTIKATYTETSREYTIQFVSKGLKLQETKALYGTTVYYTGDMPVYTAEEAAYKYYLFKGWDKSGYIDGDKTVNAVFEVCEYSEGCFDGKELSQLSQVELYTIMKLGLESNILSIKDSLDLKLGNDYSFDDIEENEIISTDMKFDGTTYYDSGISLMDVDRDFTFAIDYEFASENSTGATLAQCFQYDGANGYRLWWSDGPRLSWGTDSQKPSSGTSREIVVLRHKAGEEIISVFNSHLTGDTVTSSTLTAIRIPVHSSTLVFGAAKADDGIFESYAKGTIHWCKLWYADLGDQLCSSVVQWTHEVIPMELAKFRAYYLADIASKRAPITFLASNLLGVKRGFTNKSTNEGGWANSSMNSWLNKRIINALPPTWKALVKPVKVYSSIGNKSNDLSMSTCYFYIPSLYEVDGTSTQEPYINETNAPIPYMLSDDSRRRSKVGTPNISEAYWTRSPNIQFNNYVWSVDENGAISGYSYPSYENGVLLMFSIGV